MTDNERQLLLGMAKILIFEGNCNCADSYICNRCRQALALRGLLEQVEKETS